MAKHAVSFRELLVLRNEARLIINNIQAVEELGIALPSLVTTKVRLMNRKNELNSIMRDRRKESEARQAIIGYGVEF
jgi:hypothetical protein